MCQQEGEHIRVAVGASLYFVQNYVHHRHSSFRQEDLHKTDCLREDQQQEDHLIVKRRHAGPIVVQYLMMLEESVVVGHSVEVWGGEVGPRYYFHYCSGLEPLLVEIRHLGFQDGQD